MCSGIASDVNPKISDIYHFEAMINNTRKPVVFTAWNIENLKTIVKMAEVVAGGEEDLKNNPFIALYTEPISPLTLAKEATQKLMYMAEKSLPVVFTPCMITGATGPATLAGSLVQANVEMLAGFVLANLTKKGVPLIYGGGVGPMDMATGIWSYASPEFMLATSALKDLASYYRFPVFSFAGCSDSKLYDPQASLESALWILMASLSGGNLVHDVGYVEYGLTTSFEQIIVSHEVVGMVRRIIQGFEMNEETMALDLIDKIGPGGEYLSSEHTLKHFKENWFPDLISRTPYEKWKAEGKKDLHAKAKERVRQILENHAPKSLEGNIRKELRKIVETMEE